jgi:hypothetical protein
MALYSLYSALLFTSALWVVHYKENSNSVPFGTADSIDVSQGLRGRPEGSNTPLFAFLLQSPSMEPTTVPTGTRSFMETLLLNVLLSCR